MTFCPILFYRGEFMTAEILFHVNGEQRKVATESERSLLEVLREDLDLTGTKYGCGEGECRACTVLVDGKAVQSCRTKVASVQGKKVETIESLGTEGKLHPVQAAFLEAEAMQCGYCVPGMIMTAVGFLRGNASPSREQIVQAMNGNLCRCCGYKNLLSAVEAAAKSK
jgi:aerobic-type carbon monoxide dehydrogenase small subunit (CoxS/CutS family)